MKLTIILATTLFLGICVGTVSALVELSLQQDNYGDLDVSLSSIDPLAVSHTTRAQVEVAGTQEHDFGVIDRETEGSHTFVFRNVGSGPLKLSKGETSCKCTFSEIARNTVPPGETAEVTVNFSPGNSLREYRQTATVLTNDPSRPKVQLVVKGYVTQKLDAVPGVLTFTGLSSEDSARSGFVDVLCYQDSEFAITATMLDESTIVPFVEVDYDPLTDDQLSVHPYAKSGYRLHIRLKSGLPKGAFLQRIRVVTDVEGVDPLVVVVEGRVTSDLSIVSGRLRQLETYRILDLGIVQRGEGLKVPVFLLAKGPYRNELKLSAKTDAGDALKVKIADPKDMQAAKVVKYDVTVEVPPDASPVNYLGTQVGKYATLVFETGHQFVPPLKLYVKFAIE